MVPSSQITEIRRKLYNLEAEKGIRIIFASICGSRAYELNTENSDFDTHFVYVYPKDRYLDLEAPQDFIDLGDDITGYKLRKFCGMMSKSAWNVYEMLHSPYIVIGSENAEYLRNTAWACFNKAKTVNSLIGCTRSECKRILNLRETAVATYKIEDQYHSVRTESYDIVKALISKARLLLTAYRLLKSDGHIWPDLNFDKLLNSVVSDTDKDLKKYKILPKLSKLKKLAEYKRRGEDAEFKLISEVESGIDDFMVLVVECTSVIPPGKLTDEAKMTLNSCFKSYL